MPKGPIGRALCAALLVLLLVSGCDDDDGGSATTDNAAACEGAVTASLQTCVGELSAAYRDCYDDIGSICEGDDRDVLTALDAVDTSIRAQCLADLDVQTAGYGPLLTVAAVVRRAQESCRSESMSLAARAFGGPHGGALADVAVRDRPCLFAAHEAGTTLLEASAGVHTDCVDATRSSSTCDVDAVDRALADLADAAAVTVTAACQTTQAKIGIDIATFVSRTAAQADCLTATAHPHNSPLALTCGPREDVAAAPRGEYVQVVLDESVWGTRCGNGSPFAFQLRLAPEGHPVENVLIAMQGGGVCVFEQDCASRPQDLFEALSDAPPTTSIMSNDPAVSPFANWTKVYLPYCNQDVFIGGGVVSDFPSVTVHRFGAVNVRAAMRYVRDVLWRELDRTAEGYRNDRVRALFGGFSAGAFGTLYNYHWVLDDLQWAHTAAFPDAGLALDNGEPVGVAALGALVINGAPPMGWGSRPYTPSYCFRAPCAVGPNALAAYAPRLKAVPEQQILILSNQIDDTQVGTTFFSNRATWINTMRDSYCATKDLNGVHYFLPAVPENVHVISTRTDLYTSRPVDGETMRDWLAGAVEDGDAVVDRVEEGNLVEVVPGVEPFACEVAP
jgi:hypothetical protein